MSKKYKICSKRSAFLCFLAIILALLIVYGLFTDKLYISIICFTFFILLLVYSIVNKYKTLFFIFIIIFSSFLIYGFCTFNYVNDIAINEDKIYTITGKVPSVQNEEVGYISFVLENCTIKDADKIIYDNMDIKIIYMGDSYNVTAGDIITFNDYLIKEEIYDFGKFNSFSTPYNIYFSCITYAEITTLKNDQTIKDKIHLKVKDAFFDAMDYKSASLAYAVTFGDKNMISQNVSDGFKYSGLAHILAVSGLHTTIIFTMIAFLLSRIRFLNKYVTGTIIAILLIFYAYLCNFAPSIVRASIMCIIAYFALCSSLKSDFLNTLGISGIIILIFNPLDLFNVGFCLSFACMLGIALFAKPLYNLFSFMKIDFIKSTLSMTTATQITTLPFMAYYFGYFSFISFIANVILLPIFTFLFTFIIIGAIISLLFTPYIYLQVLSFFLNIFIDLSVYLASFDYLIVPLCEIGIIGILCYLILMFVIRNKLFIKKTTKIILCSALITTVIISCIYSSTPKTELNTSFSVKDTANDVHYFKIEDEFTLINPFCKSSYLFNTSNTLDYLNEAKIEHLVVVHNFDIKLSQLKNFLYNYKVINCYIPYYLYDENSALIQLLKIHTNLIIMEDMHEYDIGTTSKLIQITDETGYFKYIMNNKQFIIK